MYLPLAWTDFLKKNERISFHPKTACRNFGMSSTYLSRDSVSLGGAADGTGSQEQKVKSQDWGWGGVGGCLEIHLLMKEQ